MSQLRTIDARRERAILLALVALAVFFRFLVWLVVEPEIVSDSLAYFMMADSMAQGFPPIDQHGQYAFYSIGYPLVLVPIFAVAGATPPSAIVVNLILAGATAWLVHGVARAIGLAAVWRLLAVAAYGVWLPGIWNSAHLARENLSTPLLLAVVWLAIAMLDGRRMWSKGLACGIAYGAAILAGGSALPLIAAPLVAAALAWFRYRASLAKTAAALMIGAALCLAPWIYTTQQLVGQPTLNTNGGFNLYLGNNPAANGRFVSIADTPVGPSWEQMRVDLGEVGASKALGQMAREYAMAHPVETLGLTAKRLALFWAPNWPSAQDVTGSKAMLAIRSAEVLQYLLLIVLAFIGASSRRVRFEVALVVALAILGFWAIHGVTYNIPRYRDPVMPLLIVFAALGVRQTCVLLMSYRSEPRHAAATD